MSAVEARLNPVILHICDAMALHSIVNATSVSLGASLPVAGDPAVVVEPVRAVEQLQLLVSFPAGFSASKRKSQTLPCSPRHKMTGPSQGKARPLATQLPQG